MLRIVNRHFLSKFANLQAFWAKISVRELWFQNTRYLIIYLSLLSPAVNYIAVKPVIPGHWFPLVGDMKEHVLQPFQRIENYCLHTVFVLVFHLSVSECYVILF